MFEKKNYTEKIIQFGEGVFLRGFVDWIVQVTNEKTDFDASVVIVQPQKIGRCQMLEEQNCVYTHIMRGLSGGVPTTDKKVIDSISRTVLPYEDYESYLKLAEIDSFRFFTSNTTEAGIAFDENDTPEKAPEITYPAKVATFLKRRFDLKKKGFIFLPCELIDKNGETLKKYVLQYGKMWNYGEDFLKWVEEENIFCNTLVDRIVTGYPADEKFDLGYEDNMLDTSELFHLWVIEGPACIENELPFKKAGLNVIFTDNLERYRTRKVRILNGAHTSMIPYALLSGLETVGDCMKDEKMSAFVKKCVYDEIVPTLDLPESELRDYADNVFERFENPFIRHMCSAISLNSISKFKVRVLPSILEYIKRKNEMPQNLIFSFAKLIQFYKTSTPTDDEKVVEFIKNNDVDAILANVDFWGQDVSFLAQEVKKYL